MTEAVIKAELANYKIIQSRKVLQIILEVDISQADQVTSALGWPDIADNKYVAIARLNKNNNPEGDNNG